MLENSGYTPEKVMTNKMDYDQNPVNTTERENIEPIPRWAEESVDEVFERFPDRETYVVAAGISPSGVVHFGNFRDIMTCYPVVQEFRKRGKEVTFLFSWDDFDRFRKVPKNLSSELEEHIGKPLTLVPDPSGKENFSYARHFEEELETALEKMGIKLDFRYQTKYYESGAYDELIFHSMNSRKEIAEILLRFMSDKAIKRRGIIPEEFIENYYPISLYSRFTRKDNTEILKWDGKSKVTYLCNDTGKKETVDLTEHHIVKLQWKVDWPMRWKYEGVVFEPGGHDHASPGGSFDVASIIAREIFDIEPPVFREYKFIGIVGMKGKMSGSLGEKALSPNQLLDIYEPELLKWVYMRKNPNQPFNLSFDTEIFRLYDEYDRKFSNDDNISFRQAVAFGNIMQWNSEEVFNLLDRMGVSYDKEKVTIRLEKARSWLEKYNPEEEIRILGEPNKEYASTLGDEQKERIRKLKELIDSHDNFTLEEIESAVYNAVKNEEERKGNIEDKKSLRNRQKQFFKDMYNLLIGADKGPRLSTFLYALDKKEVSRLFDI